MEQIPVLIIGAGPAGLALGLSLAKHKIQSIILEKENGITDDPRGIFLAGDSVRILWDLGIKEQFKEIGEQCATVNLHKTDFKTPPFFTLDTWSDSLNQVVPDGLAQIQPRLEHAMRCEIKDSPFCELREGCKAASRVEYEDHVVLEYKNPNDGFDRIQCSWLIGADGKKGVVRKNFLEPVADIRQEIGLFTYTGTWIAANLKITLPTPETHPKFPLWQAGFTPEQVYEFFWPGGFHFCSPPGKATASGRFGPTKDRFWRHEFAEPGIISNRAEDLLWEHLMPMITRTHDENSGRFPGGPLMYPRDCIDVKRCRPFNFEQKVVNKWFHNRTILIGDAAHVFPPFGGQGIACGVRDAHGLAWRLALLLNQSDMGKLIVEKILTAWSLERRQGVDDSTRLTMSNGKLANEGDTIRFFLARTAYSLLSTIPFVSPPTLPQVFVERAGYKTTKAGFFLSSHGGGGKLAQIYLQSHNRKPFLSDELLKHGQSILTLLVLTTDFHQELADVTSALRTANLHPSVLTNESVCFVTPHKNTEHDMSLFSCQEVFYATPRQDLRDREIRPGYDEKQYFERLGAEARFAILRPDFYIFAVAKDVTELGDCLRLLGARFREGGNL